MIDDYSLLYITNIIFYLYISLYLAKFVFLTQKINFCVYLWNLIQVCLNLEKIFWWTGILNEQTV